MEKRKGGIVFGLYHICESPGDEAKGDELRTVVVVEEVVDGEDAFAGLGVCVVCVCFEGCDTVGCKGLVGAES